MSVFDNLHEVSINFSSVVGIPIYNISNQKIGRLSDFFVDYDETYPSVLAIQYKRNNRLFYISWKDVASFSLKKIIIKNESFVGRSRTFPKSKGSREVTSLLASQFAGDTIEFPSLGKIVLDKQIVDTFGKKVVRVNDIQFLKAGQNLRVTHAAIGVRSMVRRLGFESIVDNIFKFFSPHSKYLTKETLINWKYVHAIPNRSIQSSVKLNLTNEDIKDLHPADLADILEDLDNHGRELIFGNLDPQLAAETLSEVDDEIKAVLIKSEDPVNAAKIIEMMDTDDAADVLNELSKDRAGAIISKIEDDEIQEEIQDLLEYDENTAGGLMSSEVFLVNLNDRQSTILKTIQKDYDDLENIYDVYAVNQSNELIGTCSLQKILIQTEDVSIEEIMNSRDIKSLRPDTSWREVAIYMSKYNLINVPIVDESNKILGIVSVDDVLPWLLKEKS